MTATAEVSRFDPERAASLSDELKPRMETKGMPNEKEIKALEDGIITVFHGLGEEAARAICVGELKPFGDAVIALEKRKLEAET